MGVHSVLRESLLSGESEATPPTADLNVGWVAIGSRYDVISDEVPELGAEGAVGRSG